MLENENKNIQDILQGKVIVQFAKSLQDNNVIFIVAPCIS